jgi:hypothetical protein
MEQVFVCVVGHRHGQDLWVGRTEKAVSEVLADYCREWWDDNVLLKDQPAPDDDNEAIQRYFAVNEDEDFDIYVRNVIGT